MVVAIRQARVVGEAGQCTRTLWCIDNFISDQKQFFLIRVERSDERKPVVFGRSARPLQ